MSNELPRLEACLSLYSDIWDAFGTDRFEPDDLARHERATTRELRLPDDPRHHLELLVAYGLLDRINGSEFCIQCPPNEPAWQDRFADRAEQLYSAVRAVREKRARSGERCITYRERTYVWIDVAENATVETVANRIDAEMDRLRDGVVLCCPADQAGIAQSIADDLGDPNESGTIPPFAFEKVASEVTGRDTDALQFRLYIAPVEQN